MLFITLNITLLIGHGSYAFKLRDSDSAKAINNGSACSVLFLSMTGLFPARTKILEHETQSSPGVLETIL